MQGHDQVVRETRNHKHRETQSQKTNGSFCYGLVPSQTIAKAVCGNAKSEGSDFW